MDKEIHSGDELQISGQEISKLIVSQPFQKLVAKQEKLTSQSREGLEAGFDVLRQIDSPIYFYAEKTNVGSESVGRGEHSNYYPKMESGQFIPLISLHIHPGEASASAGKFDRGANDPLTYSVSAGDLEELMTTKEESKEYAGFDTKPISIVVIPISKKKCEMLIVQPTSMAIMDEDFSDEYSKDRQTWKTRRETLSALSQYGFKATYVTYENGSLSSEDQLAIQSFGFTAKKVKNDIDGLDFDQI